MEEILAQFPDLSKKQIDQLAGLAAHIRAWNPKINLVSRKDIDALELHHILHSLAIAKWTSFVPGTGILDLGTGGGFPGLPLAVLFPECRFQLVDARSKKIRVVQEIADTLKLENVKALHIRVEEMNARFEFVVTRAVASMDQLLRWTRKRFSDEQKNALPNGMIALKGGDVEKELKTVRRNHYVETHTINTYFGQPYFADKHIVYVQM